MVVGADVDDVISVTGRLHPIDGICDWNPIRKALRYFGVQYGPLLPGKDRKAIPPFCIAFISDTQKHPRRCDWGHTVVVLDGLVYDPGFAWPVPIRVFEDYILDHYYSPTMGRKMHWTSFLPILSEPPGYADRR